MTKDTDKLAENCCATPLIELLRLVPVDARLEIEHRGEHELLISWESITLGKHCHDAADKIDEQTAALEAAEARNHELYIEARDVRYRNNCLQSDFEALGRYRDRIKTERDQLQARIAVLEGYAEHLPDCEVKCWKCTCGLAEALEGNDGHE